MVREGYNSISLDDESVEGLRELQEQKGFKTIPETIRWLLLNNMPFKIEMLMGLVDSERNPFNYLMLEIDATKSQMNKVLDLMDKTQTDLKHKKKITHRDFEMEIYNIFPKHRGDYHLAESIIGILCSSGNRWDLVKPYMIKNGMNANNMR